MKTAKTYRLISLGVLFIGLLLISDTFLLPLKEIVEIKADGHISRSRTSVHHSYTTYFIISESNHTYNVTEDIWAGTTIGKPFVIFRSFIFHKPVKLSWCEEDNCYIQNIGTMNKTIFSYLTLAFLVAWPLLHFLKLVNTTGKKYGTWNYLAPILAAATFVFYLVY
jgi:hypothetical protein